MKFEILLLLFFIAKRLHCILNSHSIGCATSFTLYKLSGCVSSHHSFSFPSFSQPTDCLVFHCGLQKCREKKQRFEKKTSEKEIKKKTRTTFNVQTIKAIVYDTERRVIKCIFMLFPQTNKGGNSSSNSNDKGGHKINRISHSLNRSHTHSHSLSLTRSLFLFSIPRSFARSLFLVCEHSMVLNDSFRMCMKLVATMRTTQRFLWQFNGTRTSIDLN